MKLQKDLTKKEHGQINRIYNKINGIFTTLNIKKRAYKLNLDITVGKNEDKGTFDKILKDDEGNIVLRMELKESLTNMFVSYQGRTYNFVCEYGERFKFLDGYAMTDNKYSCFSWSNNNPMNSNNITFNTFYKRLNDAYNQYDKEIVKPQVDEYLKEFNSNLELELKELLNIK